MLSMRLMLIIIAVSLASCKSVTYQRVDHTDFYLVAERSTEYIKKSNYSINERIESGVGESIVKVKEYAILYADTGWLLSPETVDLAATNINAEASGNIKITLKEGEKYKISSVINISGSEYFAVSTNNGDICSPCLIVNKLGGIESLLVYGDIVYGGGSGQEVITVSQKTPLEMEERAVLSTHPTSNNFEVIFFGVVEKLAKFEYRKYTANDILLDSSIKELTFDVAQKQIQIAGLTIEIFDISEHGIIFSVVSDGG